LKKPWYGDLKKNLRRGSEGGLGPPVQRERGGGRVKKGNWVANTGRKRTRFDLQRRKRKQKDVWKSRVDW